MTWSLSASGHTDDPALERTLAETLGQVLAQAGSAVNTASFSSASYAGDPRQLATPVNEVPE